jgi:large subunit ribosomal protein L21
MYAIVETGGKQYRVTPGDILNIDKVDAEPKATIEIDRVLAVAADGNVTVGTPMVDGAKVVCTVLRQFRGKKVMAIRYKAKKNVRVKRGHRQYLTSVRVESIEA